ncbi:hypothetical protein [Haemophilus influenzae]|uniref:hypothetical protein n=1 Tax=Haemophilus influenzae TaxID=727 RepID=UPI0002F9061C|nr:hypothetical protein [Haemophilus influenzae]
MIKYTPKHQVKVGGKMSEKDAGIVGNKLANSAIIASIGFAVGFILIGLGYFLK